MASPTRPEIVSGVTPLDKALFDGIFGEIDDTLYLSTSFDQRLPALRITAEDGESEPTNKETYVRCTYEFSDGTSYAGRFRGRGNSTWGLPKKPWKVKLDTASTPLGLGSSKDFVLLANYLDPSFIRNSLYFRLSSLLGGFLFVPKGQHVRVIVNGEYRGVYWFGEDVRLETNRLNYPSAGTGVSDLSGNYLLEIDRRYPGSGDKGFTTTEGVRVALDTPDGAAQANIDYISSWVQTFETALMGVDWLDPVKGYAKYVDFKSFATWYLVNELIANIDSDFFSSVKMLKTRDATGAPGKLFMAAPWDADQSVGMADIPPNQLFTIAKQNGHDEVYKGAVWIRRMFEDPAFKRELLAQWSILYQFVKTGKLGKWISRASRNMSAERMADTWIWSSTAPNVTDLTLRQRLVAFIEQRAEMLQEYITNAAAETTWVTMTSESFTGSGNLVGRITDAYDGGAPLMWDVSSNDPVWKIVNGGLGWDTTDVRQQVGFQVPGRGIEIEFDKLAHSAGNIRCVLGANSLSGSAAMGVALVFTPYDLVAAYPPVDWFKVINKEAIWNQTNRIKVRLDESGMKVYINGVLKWETAEVIRAGDWVFFDKDTSTAGGKYFDNMVIRQLTSVATPEPEPEPEPQPSDHWEVKTSDAFTTAGPIAGRTSDATLGGTALAYVTSNTDSGFVVANGGLALSGAGKAQRFGTEVEGPVQVQFKLLHLPSEDAAKFMIRTGNTAVTATSGPAIEVTKFNINLGYNGAAGWTSVVKDAPPADAWAGKIVTVEHVNQSIRVSVGDELIISVDDARRDGNFVTIEKPVGDTVQQLVIDDLKFRTLPRNLWNLARSPGAELSSDGWNGWGATYSRVAAAAHSGKLGRRAVFKGGGGTISADTNVGPGKTANGEIWVRADHNRKVRGRLRALSATVAELAAAPNVEVDLVANEWTKIVFGTLPLTPADTAMVGIEVFDADGSGWVAGQIVDADDLVIRAW